MYLPVSMHETAFCDDLNCITQTNASTHQSQSCEPCHYSPISPQTRDPKGIAPMYMTPSRKIHAIYWFLPLPHGTVDPLRFKAQSPEVPKSLLKYLTSTVTT